MAKRRKKSDHEMMMEAVDQTTRLIRRLQWKHAQKKALRAVMVLLSLNEDEMTV